MGEKKIKVGVIMKELAIQAWQYLMLQKITECEFAEIVFIAADANSLVSTKKKISQFSLLALYIRMESRFSKQKSSFAIKNPEDIIKAFPFIKIQAIRTSDNAYEIPKEDTLRINKFHPDVLINLDFPLLKGEILNSANYGVWAYDPPLSFENKNFISQLINNSWCSYVSLKMYNNDYINGKAIYKSYSAKNIILNKNINWLYWKAASFVVRKLKEIFEKNTCSFYEIEEEEENNFNANQSSLIFLFRQLYRITQKTLTSRFISEQWILYCNFHKNNPPQESHKKYHELIPPKSRFWADPCVFSSQKNQHFIFIEELIYKQKKAHISVIEVSEDGKSTEPIVVLEKPYHLSYPFVFKDGDEIYMIPETSAHKTIDLYKCVSFPAVWEFKMSLIKNIHAVDATIHFDDNKYWLFVNIKENDGASDWDELYLFYSSELLTENWQAHPDNPVISDVRKSRPAGRIFCENGKFYRPSQDSSCTYGYAININEIITLSETKYVEKRISSIVPWTQNMVATHTLSNNGKLSVIDARRKIRKYY